MSLDLSRRSFVIAAPSLCAIGPLAGAVGATSAAMTADGPLDQSSPAVYREFPSQDPQLVRAVVGAAHVNLDRVRELVEPMPELAKSSWDWGFGDWESALGAASHMGRRDIADLLIEHGARPNIYTAAMMGNLEVVKAWVAFQPGIQRQHGPHGITLLDHARHGREPAAKVVTYLESLGDANQRYASEPLSDEDKQRYLGMYAFGEGDDDRVEILLSSNGMVSIRRGERTLRRMIHLGENTFHPGGAPSVRVRFVEKDGVMEQVSVHAPEPIMVARRVSGA